MTARTHRSSPLVSNVLILVSVLVASLLSATSSAHPQNAAPPAPPTAPTPPGTIVPGPASVRAFSPPEAVGVIPARDVNLKALFEELGTDAALWYQHVLTLSNPFFEGRVAGTHGIEVAGDYVEFWFREYDLEPAFPSSGETPGGSETTAAWSSYRQPFDYESQNPNVEVLDAMAAINGDELVANEQFVVLGNSGNGRVTAPITFVGYGIEEGRDGYTSFDDQTDLTGRIALVMRYEPLNDEGGSRWSPQRFSRFSSIGPKMRALSERGAAGIILVNPPGATEGATGLESAASSARFGRRLDIPVVQVMPDVAEKLLKLGSAEDRDLLAWRKLADNGEITSVKMEDTLLVTLESKLDVDDRLYTQNVGAVLHGKGALADKWIVIGGHYDHVGYGFSGAMPSNRGQVHPGADDNASGTAGVLISAKRLSEAYANARDDANLRSILFMAFGAEEAGLFGSRHYIANATLKAEDVSLMINMDMIGRLRSGNLNVQGMDTAEDFAAILKPHIEQSGLVISTTPGGRGPSDHSNFFNAGIPVLFTFTGVHADYHRPSDHGYTVNPAGAIRVLDFVQAVALDVAARPEQLQFSGTRQDDRAEGGEERQPPPAAARDVAPRTGARVRLGIMPAYNAELETGLLVESVDEGTSAAEGGVKPGDIILSWNGEEMTGGQRLMELLVQAAPGDKVNLLIRRDEKELPLEITLKAREE